MKNTPKKLILIDGNAIIHRSYHALPPLTTKSGELVNAVYGFTSTLLSVIAEFKPDYIAASFDLAGPTFRHEQFEQYKANRVKGDDELYAQIPRVKEVVEAFNIPIYEKAGFEADDMIGTLAKQAEKENIEVIIVTGDMDTLQLVSDLTKVYAMRRGLSDSVLYDEAKVFERYSFAPDQLRDFKGLRGDPSDNIPGVKGIGEKTAITLLQQYKTLEGVYEHLNEVKGAVKDKLERDKANAILSKNLATIDKNAPVSFEKEKALLHEFDREKIVKLLGELNFYSLVKRLPQSDTQKDADFEMPANSSGQGVQDIKHELIKNSEVKKFVAELEKQKGIAIYLEKSDSGIVGISFSWKTGRAGFVEATKENLVLLKDVLENASVAKIGFDLKDAYKKLQAHNIKLSPLTFDVMLAQYVLDPGKKIDFVQLVFAELGEEMPEMQQKKKQLSLLEEAPKVEEVAQHACKYADYIFKLKMALEKKLSLIAKEQQKNGSRNTLETVLNEIEMPLVEILGEMELAGVKLNTTIFKGISEKITKRLQNLEQSIYKYAGGEFNINSPRQLADVLFEKLELPTFGIKKGKTGYSTAADELEKLKGEHKIIEKIEEYRELFKLKTTYLDTLPQMVDSASRLHTTFNQAVAATGRLSSADPNLQNIPIKTELGQLMRTAFVAEDGYKLISADYSQIDLRCVAHVSGDKKMIEAFHRGDDIHRLTAAEVNKVTPSQVTDKMRSAAKALNFGIIYGVGAYGFSQSAGISREEAQKFIDAYMEKFSGVAAYMKKTREFVKKHAYVETLLGRRRNIPEIHSPNFQVASGAERMAINMPIQGLAADIMKLSMIKVHEHFREDHDVRMLLQIHDEIILEVKESRAEQVAAKTKELMESAYPLRVPLTADVNVGDSWGEI
ncbi:MAG TPA: DNA polymerase I [Patescibacteria group bacterium]